MYGHATRAPRMPCTHNHSAICRESVDPVCPDCSKLQVGAQGRVGADLPDMAVDPVVEKSGGGKEIENDGVAHPNIHQAHPIPQNEPWNNIENIGVERGSAGKGSEELFASETNYSAVLTPFPIINPVVSWIRSIAHTCDRNTSFQLGLNSHGVPLATHHAAQPSWCWCRSPIACTRSEALECVQLAAAIASSQLAGGKSIGNDESWMERDSRRLECARVRCTRSAAMTRIFASKLPKKESGSPPRRKCTQSLRSIGMNWI